MLTVEDYEKIRKAIVRDGMSERGAAKRFRHGRATITKMLKHPSPPGSRRTRAVACPVLDPVKGVIDAWVEDEIERGVCGKQRSNATVIWKRLCEEHGFTGSVYPVRRHLREKRRSMGGEAFFPLDFRRTSRSQVKWFRPAAFRSRSSSGMPSNSPIMSAPMPMPWQKPAAFTPPYFQAARVMRGTGFV